METIMTILVTFFAGMGAGLGTGFAGLVSRLQTKRCSIPQTGY